MKRAPTEQTFRRLEKERNCWFSSVRPNGSPHLVPVWFIYHEDDFYVGMKPGSVKARNLRATPRVVLSLEDGSDVVIVEGDVTFEAAPHSAEVMRKFKSKYDWDFPADEEYGALVRITPTKWMIWGDEGNY